MSIKERIRLLLLAGEMDNLALAGKLMETLGSLSEQIKVFESVATEEMYSESSGFLSKRFIRVTNYPPQFGVFNIISKDWALYYNGCIFMMNEPIPLSDANMIKL